MDNFNQLAHENKFFAILKATTSLPGVKIDRAVFLNKELSKQFSSEIVDLAIENSPAYAGITIDQIDSISKSCINFETRNVTAISTLAGIPGGLGILGTIPADTAQYFAHLFRILQKLIYLYGWKEMHNSEGELDDEASNKLTLFMGVMFGVKAANSAIAKIALKAAAQTEKSLAKKALTKTVIFPIVKKVAAKLGYKITKGVFAKAVGKVIPIVGGAISGSLTYLTYKPSAIKLKNYLKELPIADVEFYKNNSGDIVDINFVDVDDIE